MHNSPMIIFRVEKFLYGLAPAESNWTKPILVSYEASLADPMRVMDQILFCNLLLIGVSHDTKIWCIRLVWAGTEKYRYSFLLCAGPLRCKYQGVQKHFQVVPKHGITMTRFSSEVQGVH